MRVTSPHSKNLFLLAIILSVAIHGVVIVSSSLIPSPPEVSVFNAPNSLEINVIARPFVSVIEEEIITEEIITEEIVEGEVVQEVVFHDRSIEALSENSGQRSLNSRESRGAITKAKPLMQTNLAPAYPRIARQRGWEGTVKLMALIEKDGTINQIDIIESSGYGILDKEALKTVKMWKFSPARSGLMRFSSRISIPIQFALIKE